MSIESGFQTLHEVVMKVKSDRQSYGTADYQRLLEFAMSGYDELKLNTIPEIKTVYLTIDDKFTVPYPDDYLHYTAIGVVCGGRVITLTLDDRIAMNYRSECPMPIEQVAAASEEVIGSLGFLYPFSGAFRGGQYVGEQYGIGGGYNSRGYYRDNIQMRRFEFANTLPGREIILEYDSTGVDCNGIVKIHKSAVEPIRQYVHAQIDRFDIPYNAGKAAMSNQRWVEQYQAFVHYNCIFTLSEFMDNMYKSMKMLKR